MKSATEDYSWKSLSSECIGADGMGYLEAMIREGAITALGRSETRVMSRSTMEKTPWEGPSHGRLYPVVGFANEGGYRYVIVRDAWGLAWNEDQVSKGPPNEENGHSRIFKVQCEKLSEQYDTILTCRFIDSLKDSAVSGEYRHAPWRTLTMQATSLGEKAPATLKLVVPPGAYRDSATETVAQKRTRSEFGRELTLAQKYAEEKKAREREEKEFRGESELDRLAKITKPIDVALTVSALQDWSEVGSLRADVDGQLALPTIRLRIVPTEQTVKTVHHALKSEYTIIQANEAADRAAKAEKLRQLKEGKGSKPAGGEADGQGAALGSKLEGSLVEDGDTDTKGSGGDSGEGSDERKDGDTSVSGVLEDASMSQSKSEAPSISESKTVPTGGADADSESKAKGTDTKEGKDEGKDEGITRLAIGSGDVAEQPVADAKPKKEKVVQGPSVPPRRSMAGLDSRHGLVITPTPHVLEEVTEATPWAPGGVDPVPDVTLSAQRSWLSHSVSLYPGEYAVYVDVTYNVGVVGRDLTFDRTGELGERPWQESEMSTEEITGAVKLTAAQLDARPKKVWTQFSSNHDFNVDVTERTGEYTQDVSGIFVDEERWPFMAESQAEAATRRLVERMATMHHEMLSMDTLVAEARTWAKRK